MFDQECTFWHTITGWSLNDSPLGEFRSLERPDGQPLRFLLQRLDENLSPNQPHAHLDLACAENIEAIGRRHRAIGASVLGPTKVWMRMQDPAGLDYCLTPRGFNPDR